MTSRRSIGSVLVLLACCMATMASTASAAIPAPPGGPILVVTPAGRTSFQLSAGDPAHRGSQRLRPRGHRLGERGDARRPRRRRPRATCRSATDQVGDAHQLGHRRAATSSPCARDGSLARPARPQRPSSSTPAAGGYLRVNTSSGARRRHHQRGDAVPRHRRPLRAQRRHRGREPVRRREQPHGNPAVSLRDVGANGGQAAAFTYDLAQSVVETRQGNPAWAGQDRDGSRRRSGPTISSSAAPRARTGSTSTRPRSRRRTSSSGCWPTSSPRWRATPMPRFWYLPNGLQGRPRAHRRRPRARRRQRHGDPLRTRRGGKPSCSAAELVNWDCVRSTSYIYPDSGLTAADVAHYRALGLRDRAAPARDRQLERLQQLREPRPRSRATSTRSSPSSRPRSRPPGARQRAHPLHRVERLGRHSPGRVPTTASGWTPTTTTGPARWVGDRPGLFTGSGFPQRFANADGSLIDIYQSTTQLNDELYDNAAAEPATELNSLQVLLGNALSDNPGYYGVITANNHNDLGGCAGGDAIVAAARRTACRSSPSEQLLDLARRAQRLGLPGRRLQRRPADVQHRPGVRCARAAGHGPDQRVDGRPAGPHAQRRSGRDLHAHGQGHRLRGVRCAERQLRRDLPGAQRRRRRDRRDGDGLDRARRPTTAGAARPPTTAPTRRRPRRPSRRSRSTPRRSAPAAGACSRSASRPRRPPSSPWS